MLVATVYRHGIRGQPSADHALGRRLAEAIVYVRDELVSTWCLPIALTACSHDRTFSATCHVNPKSPSNATSERKSQSVATMALRTTWETISSSVVSGSRLILTKCLFTPNGTPSLEALERYNLALRSSLSVCVLDMALGIAAVVLIVSPHKGRFIDHRRFRADHRDWKG